MRLLKVFLFLSFVSISANAIVGGQEVSSSDSFADSIVYLALISNEGEGACTGSIISKNTILTASHCVEGVKDIYIVFSKKFDDRNLKSLAQAGLVRKATKIVINSKFPTAGLSSAKDSALIRFEGTLPNGYRPIPILERKDLKEALLSPTTVITLSGYGRTKIPSLDNSPIKSLRKKNVKLLKAGKVEVFPGAESSAFNFVFSIGSCHGDSGGPALVHFRGAIYLFGVTSWGDPECSKVDVYSSFLRNSIGQHDVSK